MHLQAPLEAANVHPGGDCWLIIINVLITTQAGYAEGEAARQATVGDAVHNGWQLRRLASSLVHSQNQQLRQSAAVERLQRGRLRAAGCQVLR